MTTNDVINLYVDDIRPYPEGFELARSYKDAVYHLKNSKINILSLDHDLGGKKTGYDIVKLICENGVQIKEIYLHTDNPVGRENMFQALLAAKERGFINPKTRISKHSKK